MGGGGGGGGGGLVVKHQFYKQNTRPGGPTCNSGVETWTKDEHEGSRHSGGGRALAGTGKRQHEGSRYSLSWGGGPECPTGEPDRTGRQGSG